MNRSIEVSGSLVISNDGRRMKSYSDKLSCVRSPSPYKRKRFSGKLIIKKYDAQHKHSGRSNPT